MDERVNGTETSTLVAAVPSGWAYLGCNWDSRYNRQLNSLSWAGENLGIARCAAYCDSFNYFGVENGEDLGILSKATKKIAISIASTMTAYRPSPQPGADLAAGSITRQSPTPPPLTKRDKRRNAMAERLRDIEDNFASNRDFYYRQQLQALQRDANIITCAEPYRNQPLDEPMDENGMMGQPRSGKWARGFIEQVNNAMEERDTNLSLIVDRHNFRIRELKEDYEYAVMVADKEYTYLLNVLRTRLTQTIEQKRAALLKERDKLEITDTASLLLNPNHFNYINPSSPGGPQSNRKTRQGRHRYDVDDDDRKRKLPADPEKGSPGPSSRNAEVEAVLVQHPGLATPPSMGHLFTDKELVITNQEASYAAIQDIFAKRKKFDVPQRMNLASYGTSEEDNLVHAQTDGADEALSDDIFLTAPAMDRTANSSIHATRSTRNINPPLSNIGFPLQSLGDLAGRAAAIKYMGSYNSYNKERKLGSDDYPKAPGLTDQEVEDDLTLMAAAVRDAETSPGKMNMKLVEDLVAEVIDYTKDGIYGDGGSRASSETA
ncbi:MAG: hypothetical protein Q9182_004320 [Xanthomendoza sp. 2 TL-2023]